MPGRGTITSARYHKWCKGKTEEVWKKVSFFLKIKYNVYISNDGD